MILKYKFKILGYSAKDLGSIKRHELRVTFVDVVGVEVTAEYIILTEGHEIMYIYEICGDGFLPIYPGYELYHHVKAALFLASNQ
jgi:hypothetical protein